jgi:hypothetical protein
MKSKKRAFLSLFLAITTIVWLGFFAMTGNAIASPTSPTIGDGIYIAQAMQAGERLVKGEEKKIGDGTVRTWVKLGKDRKPVSIGVTMTESGLTGLPDDVDTGKEKGQESTKLKLLDQIGHYTFENELKFPPEAAPYVHMGYNWNPYGHWPQQVFTEPHYDVHFYMETPEYRHEIGKGNYKDILKGHKKLPPELVPKGYEIAYGTLEPRMGIHWANFSSPELQPGKFNKIFLFGSFNGRMLFWEPMITQKFLQKKIADYSEVISQPAAYPKSGYYPMTYSIKYDLDRKEFDISLDDLVYREGTEVASNALK